MNTFVQTVSPKQGFSPPRSEEHSLAHITPTSWGNHISLELSLILFPKRWLKPSLPGWDLKQLAIDFSAHLQASVVLLILTDVCAPCLMVFLPVMVVGSWMYFLNWVIASWKQRGDVLLSYDTEFPTLMGSRRELIDANGLVLYPWSIPLCQLHAGTKFILLPGGCLTYAATENENTILSLQFQERKNCKGWRRGAQEHNQSQERNKGSEERCWEEDVKHNCEEKGESFQLFKNMNNYILFASWDLGVALW